MTGDTLTLTPVADSVEIERTRFGYRWWAYGELRHARRRGPIVLLPVPGIAFVLGDGLTLTRWGAERRARRALTYCR